MDVSESLKFVVAMLLLGIVCVANTAASLQQKAGPRAEFVQLAEDAIGANTPLR